MNEAMPDLDFAVEGVEIPDYAAVPALVFKLRLSEARGGPVRAVSLNVQIRIDARRRSYAGDEERGLIELFGEPHRWSDSLQSLLWSQVVVQVPAFSESSSVDLAVPCSYDFEVASAKYFHVLKHGEIPLDFLFSGTVFYSTGGRLLAGRISWEKEARFRLPVECWQLMMDRYFPNSAWLRLRREIFDQLYDYRVRTGAAGWDDALTRLLLTEQSEVGR